MTQKRKAELQRKLSMAPVARPPADLADRIKSDIPEYLGVKRDRDRLSHSVAFSLRVAASIVLLVTSVFLSVQLMSRDELSPGTDLAPAPAPPAVAASPAVAPPSTAPKLAEIDQSALRDTAEEARQPQPARPQRTAPVLNTSPRLQAAAAPPSEEKAAEGGVVGGMVTGVAGGVTGGVVSDATFAEPAPQVAAVAAPPPPPAPPLPVQARKSAVAEALAATGQAPAVRERTEGQKRLDFGLSTTHDEMDRLKKELARGGTPKDVDVTALVNHFAGSSQNAADNVQMQVEASQAPLASDRTAVIRYTIDTPARDARFQVSGARLSIVLEKGVLVSHRTVSGVRPLESSEGVLGANQSATGIVEVRLRQEVNPGERVATIILAYRSPSTGKREQVEAIIRARDLEVAWTDSSRRHRVATLGAVWAETLAGAKRPAALATTADELAGEAPNDPLAQELARVIASSRPRSSAPTGSGR